MSTAGDQVEFDCSIENRFDPLTSCVNCCSIDVSSLRIRCCLAIIFKSKSSRFAVTNRVRGRFERPDYQDDLFALLSESDYSKHQPQILRTACLLVAYK